MTEMKMSSPVEYGVLTCLCMKALFIAVIFGVTSDVTAHGVTEGDKGYILESTGILPIPFIYLGAKHMMTGYDHLLFLLGVIFFLYRLKDICIYVTLFAAGHVITLLSGVLFEVAVSPYLIDAIIGFSIVYKSLDNMGAFQRWFGFQPDTKIATFIFGLFHGFGLATKILEYELPADGLLPNLIFFNIGVEIGQILALAAILIAIAYWRKSGKFMNHAYNTNTFMMMLGFLLMGYQITGHFILFSTI
ncbi:MAG TPA: HupE/UreJ family protein [Nitrosomonas europaea]|uniref:HupE/UreJ family protein n=2 Tax=Nitrosomonadaceae TaxID=206379 RepID=UPI00249246E0|nr:HupE/UreJ family protein [Nitrosomonas europaea]HRO57217.1 HupE/UreJ family protein [Nitrosomonas europaea]HUM74120.1 HupE/UreJ family protein [Nitrosomonas europaea]